MESHHWFHNEEGELLECSVLRDDDTLRITLPDFAFPENREVALAEEVLRQAKRLARLDALLEATEPPEGLWRSLQERWVADLSSTSRQRGELAEAAWRWLRAQLGANKTD